MKALHSDIIRQLIPINFKFILLAIFLSIPALLLKDFVLLVLPIFVLIILSYIYGERFLIALILITLFTLVGELNRSLRIIVHIMDFSLLGLLFLRRFGLNLGQYPKVPKSILAFFLFYCFVMFISSSMSEYPFAGIDLITKQIIFFMIAYVFYSLIRDESDVKVYLLSITIVAIILVSVSIVILFQEGFNLLDVVAESRTRVSALISNLEALTNFYVVAFPFLITLLLSENYKKYRYYILLILFMLSLGLMLSMSRSAILGILLSSLIIIYVARRKRFYQLFFTIITLSLVVILYPPLNDTLTLFLRIEEGLSARDKLWEMSLNIINDNFIFGLGPGAYKYEFFNYFPFMLDDWWGRLMIYFYNVSEGVNFSHNYFLVFFSDMGIFGLMTAVSLIVIFFNIAIKTMKKYKQADPQIYYLIIALFAAGTSIIFRNFFNSIGLLFYGGITTDLPFWLIFGSIIYFYQADLFLEKSSKGQKR